MNTPKMNTTRLSPQLRFTDSGEDWRRILLSEVLIEHKTRNSSGEYAEVFSVAKYKGVTNQIEHLGRSYASEDITNYKVVFPNDVVYTKSPTAGFPFGIIKQNKTGRPGVVSVLYAVFAPKTVELGLLLDYYFSSPINTYNYLVPLVHKGAKNTMNIGNEDFLKGCKLSLPTSIMEQKKIAGFLHSIDIRIAQLYGKRLLLESYKKGLLQQIFTNELRFKDDNGEYFPGWKKYKGKDLFASHSNKNHNGDLTILAATQENGVVPRDSIGIDIQSSDKSIKSYKIVEKGDFVISLRSFQGGIEYSEYNGICSPAYTVLKPKQKIDVLFFKFYFKKDDFIKRLSQTVVGIRDGKQISYEAFSGLNLRAPCFREQRKISQFINSVETIIKLVSQEINQIQQYKKGLLQKIFI